MSKKTLEQRRQREYALAEAEYHLRCRHCKTVIDRIRLQMGDRFCSTECDEAETAFQERWAAAKARVNR